MKNTFFFLLFLLMFAACSGLKTDEKINAEVVNNTIKKKKIKRVLDDDIVSFAYEKGDQTASLLAKEQPQSSDSLCAWQLGELIEKLSLEGVSDITLRCEPRFFTHPKEKEMWLAYEKALEGGIEAPAGVQRLGAKQSYRQILYAMPIFYTDGAERKLAMLSILMDKKDLIMLYGSK